MGRNIFVRSFFPPSGAQCSVALPMAPQIYWYGTPLNFVHNEQTVTDQLLISNAGSFLKLLAGRTWVVLVNYETLPKAQRTRGLSSSYQSNSFRSYHKFKHKILINFHLQNLDLESTSQPNISISNKFKIQNLDQT